MPSCPVTQPLEKTLTETTLLMTHTTALTPTTFKMTFTPTAVLSVAAPPFLFPTCNPLQPKSPEHLSPKVSGPDEYSPLLVPRIEEDDSAGNDPAHPRSSAKVYRDELRILLKYTLPVLGTHLLEYSLVVASVVSIGHLSTVALAASTLGMMTASVTGYSIIQGLSSTLDTMLPSAWTSPNPQLVGLWSQRMAVVMATFLIPISFLWFNAESILLFLHQQPDVAHLAAVYLKYASIGLPAYAFNCISRRYFQSQGLFMVPTQIILVIAPINAFLNYFLVCGPEPIALGFVGAPLATAISFNLISIASIVYGIFFVPSTAWHPFSRRSFTSLGVLVKLGLGGIGQTASEWWSWELIGLAASLLGPTVLAAQSVLLVSASTAFQAPFSLSVASSVRIGNLLGERNAARAEVSAKVSMLLALFFAGVSRSRAALLSSMWRVTDLHYHSAIFLTFRNKWGYLFNDDPSASISSALPGVITSLCVLGVINLVASILPLVALFQVFDGLNTVSGGILRARGKQFTGALLNLSAYYVLGIPIGVWLAFRCNMGLHGLWSGLTVSLVYGSALGVWIALKTDWAWEVQKVQRRLEADKAQEEECVGRDRATESA
ncbi:MATE efflux family protein [Lactarius akahatsu]|uniref:MATE efflux family protein n=1 Tax=Lactarius akahatsu TaxID=416441 RepID=A0AAD4LPP3_9AGAM|nr:MATE efflux family protein [Lactarius akahatsu]